MTEKTITISKKPLITSIVLTSISAIAAVFYFIFGIESLKLIYSNDNGLEAHAIIAFLAYMIISDFLSYHWTNHLKKNCA